MGIIFIILVAMVFFGIGDVLKTIFAGLFLLLLAMVIYYGGVFMLLLLMGAI